MGEKEHMQFEEGEREGESEVTHRHTVERERKE